MRRTGGGALMAHRPRAPEPVAKMSSRAWAIADRTGQESIIHLLKLTSYGVIVVRVDCDRRSPAARAWEFGSVCPRGHNGHFLSKQRPRKVLKCAAGSHRRAGGKRPKTECNRGTL